MVLCTACGKELSSRNKLFAHLREAHGAHTTGATSTATTKVALVLAYLGTAYHGSARSDAEDRYPTVEGALWRAVSVALARLPRVSKAAGQSWHTRISSHTNPPGLTRSSRTDKGVHAARNVISCRLPSAAVLEVTEADFCAAVNAALPSDISLLRCCLVPKNFDARRCCEQRRYHYLMPFSELQTRPSADGAGVETGEASELDIRRRLKSTLRQFSGTHDFRNFTRESAAYLAANNTHRRVFRCFCGDTVTLTINGKPTRFAQLSIGGEGFLYHQIRKMVGAVVAMLRGELPSDFIAATALAKPLAESGDVAAARVHIPLAPPSGLYLVEAAFTRYVYVCARLELVLCVSSLGSTFIRYSLHVFVTLNAIDTAGSTVLHDLSVTHCIYSYHISGIAGSTVFLR